MISSSSDLLAKPFLRWAGGKTWLIKHLIKVKESSFNNYFEPFLGGAATYFYLQPNGHAYLSDLNSDLIETYQAVKKDARAVIRVLETFANTEEDYYKIREREYKSSVKRAAKFIYLNQTSFNGIYRVNLKGVYNVPYGFRKKGFLDRENLLNVQSSLKNASIETSDFFNISKQIKRCDLVFLDPPYTVSHNNNGFIKYNEKIFSLDDQIRLSQLIDIIKRKGAYYILTNAAHATIDNIFEKGDKKLILNRASLIGGVNSKRGQTNEFVFTNTVL
ncbi:Dam family site-specific DNA-(adenine-N6)-methyltransferase [Chitinophaga niabensis]|uniref:DNA adenine methylase n=1 Tax=Chitinophaga niabensis TaxID=536979 RepID=UPI0031BB8650